MHDLWNVLDFVVVTASLLSIFLSGLDLSSLRALRILRALRPLRMIQRNRGMKLVMNSLARSLTSISNALLLLAVVWLVFAILGVQLFAGRLWHCADADFPQNFPLHGTGVNGSACQQVVNAANSFDSVPQALLTLFIMTSGDDWPRIMFSAVDAGDAGMSPHENAHPEVAIYFVAYSLIGSIFFLFVIMAVLFQTFMRLRRHYNGLQVLTLQQRSWVEAQRRLMQLSPDRVLVPATGRMREWAFRVIINPVADWVITLCIVVNVLFMATSYENEPPSWTSLLEGLNIFFTLAFLLEAVLKIMALGNKVYFADRWNQFDFFTVVGSIIDLVASAINFSVFRVLRVGRTIARLLRLVRVSRALRLLKSLRGMRALVTTLWLALPSLLNVAALMLLLFFVCAVLAVNLFGEASFSGTLNEQANFSYFGIALLTLFRVSTGERWAVLMADVAAAPQVPDAFSPLFFFPFVLSAQFIAMNLFVMVLVEAFETVEAQGRVLTSDMLHDFVDTWTVFDPRGTKFIADAQVGEFLRALPPPLGCGSSMSRSETLAMIREYDVVSWGGRVHFRELLLAVTRHALGVVVPEDTLKKVRCRPADMRAASRRQGREEAAAAPLSMVMSVLTVQKQFRAWKRRAEARRKAGEESGEEEQAAKAAAGAAAGTAAGTAADAAAAGDSPVVIGRRRALSAEERRGSVEMVDLSRV
eukprot:PLAT3543.3.p1 GENE.PLAT3543.3~~PLAT3543.3.p1  ORF type:complete len:751 (+),score=243.80 PLAT3543.3:154-2253(+)